MTSKICASCRSLFTGKGTRCNSCVGKLKVQVMPTTAPPKERDPIYGTGRWRKLRDYKAKLNPLCESCLDVGRAVPMVIVDHIKEIKDGGQAFDITNLRSLCRRCHASKTVKARSGRKGIGA